MVLKVGNWTIKHITIEGLKRKFRYNIKSLAYRKILIVIKVLKECIELKNQKINEKKTYRVSMKQ